MDDHDLIQLVTEISEIEGLAGEWRPLAERQGNAFITPDWFLAFLRTCGEEWQPRVAVVRRRSGELRGMLPLVSSSAGGRRVLRFPPVGDRFQPVAGQGDERTVAVAAASALTPENRGFPTLLLENVDTGRGWLETLVEASPARLATVERAESTLPFVQIEGLSWDEYLAGRSRQLRSQLRRKFRSLGDGHDLRFRRTRRPQELEPDLGSLFRLHDARWAQRPGASAFAGSQTRAFHFEFARAALERGWLRLTLLEVDGVPIAGMYGWLIGGRWSYYQAGFDPAWSRHSPGFLLLAETIRDAIEEGASEYDMLLGEEAFKRRFATSTGSVRTVVVAPRGRPAHLSAAAGVRVRRAWRMLPSGPRTRARRFATRLGVRR
jgi:CelD/BcsL family acetyltransferase involved in cellulose biosynthesis